LKTNYQFVSGVQARYEAKKVGDNTALNGIKFFTSDFVCNKGFVLGKIILFRI
jgi:hypothetical protein